MRSLKQKFWVGTYFCPFPRVVTVGEFRRATVQCPTSKSAIMNSSPTGIGYFLLIADPIWANLEVLDAKTVLLY